MRSDRERLLDIIEAIERIRRHAATKRDFVGNELVQAWVVRHLEIIGEAAGRLTTELRDKHDEIPWSAIIALRKVLAHDYFEIDAEMVWRVVERDIPPLEHSARAILATL